MKEIIQAFLVLVLVAVIFAIPILIMIFGWGLTPVNWWIIILGPLVSAAMLYGIKFISEN